MASDGRASKWIALSIGAALGAAVLVAAWSHRVHAQAIDLAQVPPPSAAELAARRLENESLEAATAGRHRLTLDAELVMKKFAPQDDHMVFDPDEFFHRPGNLDVPIAWPEHPDGRWLMHTNSLGLREDRELSPNASGVRVLAVGDSHTDGACNNSESWPHCLEAELNSESERNRDADPGAFEVVNAGNGYFNFYHYRGAVERFRELGARVVVIGVYGGNDFFECTRYAHFFAGTERPQYDAETWKQVDLARDRAPAPLAQALCSILYFKKFPDEIDVALTSALGVCGDVLGSCEARGVRVLFVYIPSVFEVRRADAAVDSQKGLRALQLDLGDLQIADRMADRFLEGLHALGAAAVDLRAAFRESREGLYWKTDLHLNLTGNRKLAQAIAPWVAKLAPRR